MTKDIHTLKDLVVLIADDDQNILKDTATILRLFFKEVLTACNGKEAYEIYEEKHPNLILADIGMPIINGIELVRKIRKNEYETPIVIISCCSDSKILLQAVNSSIDGYIVKPIELESLIEVCCKAVKRNTNPQAKLVKFQNGLFYNSLTKELFSENGIIELGVREHELLLLFLHTPNKTITREEIIDELWALDDVSESALKSVLGRLRKKIGIENIINVKGIGWRLALEE